MIDLLPGWAKLFVVAALFSAGAASGAWVTHRFMRAEVALEQDRLTKYKNGVAEAAFRQAMSNIQLERSRNEISNTVATDYAGKRRRLTDRLRADAQTGGGGLPASAESAAGTSPIAAQSGTAEPGRTTGEVCEAAAEDAQQLAFLIDWICKQGMCTESAR